MHIDNCTKADFDQIIIDIASFWGSDRTLCLHHPLFVNEFGDTAFVIRDGDTVVAYLLGCLSQTELTAYVHLVGVQPAYRRQGLARRLYDQFATYVGTCDGTAIKAISTPANTDSIAFHRALGFTLRGTLGRNGVPVVEDYSGPARDRVVFLLMLDQF